ncbi:YqzL family protein [Paenibacillus montanisoli]|uniref:YqzL family protein n=1 Tax=Paenibacillus montanisoli TaxID=2081970 RepID=A0A328U227_9BACL|nr:YqzL family protein [Paenibacillus montanisoli]RAP76699.1 YqzL family protein [Paenibacillus montanisoli]
MRDFSWKYFTLTGDVEAFMLYKEMDERAAVKEAASGEEEGEAIPEADDGT